MTKLDLKNKKILFELDQNSRQTYDGIAKRVRLSKDAVFYRIKELEKEGIIKRYQTVIDVGKLGYMSFRIFYKLRNTTTEIEEEILDYLKSQNIVVWMVSVEGYWDINTWIVCKEIAELEKFWKDFTSKYINYLADKQLSVFTDITYFSRAYLMDENKNKTKIRFVSAPTKEKIDRTDLKILHILNLNARKPSIEIASEVGLSPKQISRRIKNLEKNKVIVGYRTMFDLEKLGYLYFRVHIQVKDLTKQKEEQFRQYAFENPNIIYNHYSLCGPDLEIDIQVENVGKLRSIINEIKNKFASIIQDYEILQYLKEYKYIYIPEFD